jgi:hypothetical protein
MRFSSLRRITTLTVAAVLLCAQASPQPAAVSCRKLSVNGSNIVPGSTLTVTVNGAAVGSHDQSASGELGPHMKPGLNRVGLSFAAPGEMGPFGTNAELRCLPPNVASSRTDILRLQPTAKRLSAEVEVNYVPQ